MKIAVLFGSFNPITNAHVTALKTAVAQLGAEKGLFVATNGEYLRRKTVKINDPFYLTEEERKETIEKICETESQLSFACFELGGINPSRYKTLCKIRKQYPDAEIYEVMGADKVRTFTKSNHLNDYLTQFKIAVFYRNGMDAEQFIAENPELNTYRASFVMLPTLVEGAEISSTEVRRRFYAGQDYCDLIPRSAVEVLQRHKPADFTISFADKMKTIMKTGRFGENNARKEVYKENLKLFRNWKNGIDEIGFGDYRAFLDGAKLYREKYTVEGMGALYPETQTGCINLD